MSEAAEFLEERPERRAPTYAGATGLAIAVLVPCYNEEATIETVVSDFRAALPQAVIYVYDNNSTDRTIGRAEAAGAIVRRERRQGKGHVVRRMFGEMQTRYKDRPPGSASKLNTYRDGIRIVNAIILLIKEERPLSFFSVIALVLALLSIALAVPLVITYVETGLVPRFPTAILSAS